MSDIGIFIFGGFVFALALTSAMVFLLMPGGAARKVTEPLGDRATIDDLPEPCDVTARVQNGSESGHAA